MANNQKRSHSMRVESDVAAGGWIYLPYRIHEAEDLKSGFKGYLWSTPNPAMGKRYREHDPGAPAFYEHDWTIFETIEDAQNDIIRRYL